MALACTITPVSAFQSTNLNNKIETFNDLGDRIKRSLGYPIISLEIHQDQLFGNIQIAIEYFSKFAGFTEEYLIFDSRIYETNKGVRLDHLFTLARAGMTDQQKVDNAPKWPGPDFVVDIPQTVYISTSAINGASFTTSTTLSSLFVNGITEFEIVDKTLYSSITAFSPGLSSKFKESIKKGISLQSQDATPVEFSNVFDYDLMDYRKVVDVIHFEEGSNQGINTLFTLEQTLAQQTYFSYALGNYGFDGVIGCYIERPIRDIIKEQWVYEYASALTKITIGRIRGKFGQVALLGGGSLNADLLNEGREEKAALEKMLLEGASTGFGDAYPPIFMIG